MNKWLNSKERKAEFAKRDWMDLNHMEDLQ